MDGESFKLCRLMGLVANVFAGVVYEFYECVTCGLARSTLALGSIWKAVDD